MPIEATRRVLLTDSSNSTGPMQNVEGRNEQRITAYAYGTFGSSTGKVQVSDGTTNWLDSTDLSFSADGFGSVEGRFGAVRGVVVGGTGNESVTLVCFADYTT